MNEVGLNARWIQKDMTSAETQEFSKKVLNFMREKLSDYQELYGDLYNLEATPAESTTYRLAKHDKDKWPDIKCAGKEGDRPYYTNSSHLPVDYTEDIFSALDIQDELQTLYTSGTVFHAFLGERMPDWQAAAKLVRTIAENYKLPYYTISPTYSICEEHGYLNGEQFICPYCGEKAEVYSRITGYYRPVQNWNEGKSQEYKNRKVYKSLKYHKSEQSKVEIKQEVQTLDLHLNDDLLEDGMYLFTTKTCPNCVVAKTMMKEVPYVTIDAEENPELAVEYGIMQAPTLLIMHQGNVKKCVNVPNIRNYLDNSTIIHEECIVTK